MPPLPTAPPDDIGIDPVRLQRAHDLLQRWVDALQIPAAALCVGRNGRALPPRYFGRQWPDVGAPTLREDALFLVASLAKPVTATAVMLLVERGQLSLTDRVTDFLPEFACNGKEDTRILHLLTHTSGLPDMVRDNRRLRQEHQPLSAFIEHTCRGTPIFRAGTAMSYQSMGSAILGEVVHQVSGLRLPEFLRREVFAPLGMDDTSLGAEPERRERIAVVRAPAAQQGTDWGWNSAYWRGLGVPWGGLITTPADFARFCLMVLGGGALGDVRILSPATVRAMTMNQLAALPNIPEVERRSRPWGLGWQLNWPGEPTSFGDLLGPRTFGHWGATGTMCWLDPDAGAFCILFTTQPLEGDIRALVRVSNVVAGSLR